MRAVHRVSLQQRLGHHGGHEDRGGQDGVRGGHGSDLLVPHDDDQRVTTRVIVGFKAQGEH